MGFATFTDVYEIEEAAPQPTAKWQLVVDTPDSVTVIYLTAADDLNWWKEECVRLFGVYPRVFAAGNFVTELHA